jgi:hypothetical protein
MADLMNQTYGNAPKREHADLTATKLIYLMGMKLLKAQDSIEKNFAFVEVANRYGVPALNKVAFDINANGDLKAALASYPIPTSAQAQELVPIDLQVKTFANDALKKQKPEAQAASHADRAMQKTEGAVLGA